MLDGRQIRLDFEVPYSFEVHFGRGLASDAKFFRGIFPPDDCGKVLFFIEDKVAYLYNDVAGRIFANFAEIPSPKIAHAPIIMPGGERNKTMEQALDACSHISRNGICRHSFVCAVGGGAFLDTICFAASISHRGVRQVRFPTTVVSQCDSGIGVKNSVNILGKKNFAGTFHPPYAVVNDFDFIDALPLREKVAGAAEAIKVAIIKDKAFFDFLSDNRTKIAAGDTRTYEKLIFRCAQLHAEHISGGGDPFESGSARPLDFGHWIAHKLESMSGGRIRHGEAVSIGMASDSFLAMKAGLISRSEFDQITGLLKDCGLPIWSKYLSRKKGASLEVLGGLDEFREHLGGGLSITLPKSIGSKIEVSEIDTSMVLEGFAHLESLQK